MIRLLCKWGQCIAKGKMVDLYDIRDSYTTVSLTYDRNFSERMKKYNIQMMEKLNIDGKKRVLDLACGTGVNIEWLLNRNPNLIITGIDISRGMLERAQEKLAGKANLIETPMLQYLRSCGDASFDIITCSWALKYENPIETMRQCFRVMEKGGQIGVILNTKGTLPEVRKSYLRLINRDPDIVKKLMRELPSPKNEKRLRRVFARAGFKDIYTQYGSHAFCFASCEEAVKWVISTGALAGFDVMIDLRDEKIIGRLIELFEKDKAKTITHKFVWGVGIK